MLNMFQFGMAAAHLNPQANLALKAMAYAKLGGTLLEVFDGDLHVGYKLTNVVPGEAWDCNGFCEGDLMLFDSDAPCALETPEDVLNLITSRAAGYKVMRTKNPNC